jgi:hypothetical protein
MVFNHQGLRIALILPEEEEEYIAIDLDQTTLLVDYSTALPRWSPDDRWIYYWRRGEASGIDQGESAVFPRWLERAQCTL